MEQMYFRSHIDGGVSACFQLLQAAHEHSGKTLFSTLEFLDNSYPLANHADWSRLYEWALSYTEHVQNRPSKFFEVLLTKLKSCSKEALACKQVEKVTKCQKCQYQNVQLENQEAHFLTYAGSDDFSSSDEFSKQWSLGFSTEGKCRMCSSTTTKATMTTYFRQWPKYLFVLANCSGKIIPNAAKHKFTIGGSNKATYELLGAVVNTYQYTHYPMSDVYKAIYKHGTNWCVGERRMYDMHEFDYKDVDMLLFVRTDDVAPRVPDPVPPQAVSSTVASANVGTQTLVGEANKNTGMPTIADMRNVNNGIQLITSTIHGTTYTGFTGRQLVDWIVNWMMGFMTRSEAVKIINTMLIDKVFACVFPRDANTVEDDDVHFYTYLPESQGNPQLSPEQISEVSTNSESSANDMVSSTPPSGQDSTIQEMKHHFTGISTFPRTLGNVQYLKSFSGQDAVDWVMQKVKLSLRATAIKILEQLVESGRIIQVFPLHEPLGFRDRANYYYIFGDEEPKKLYDLVPTTTSSQQMSINSQYTATSVSTQLDQYIVANGKGSHILQPLNPSKFFVSGMDNPVLHLPNEGNSCWVATCCQLLFCAHVRSGKQIFNFSHPRERYLEIFNNMMNGSADSYNIWPKFYDTVFNLPEFREFKYCQEDSGKFYEMFLPRVQEHMSENGKKLIACSQLETLTELCKKCQSRKISEDVAYHLQYAGNEDFRTENEFSAEWKTCFEYTEECTCGFEVNIKRYYLHWPKYLFVLSTCSEAILRNALKSPFSIGESTSATYEPVGAAMHSGGARGGHYTALVKYDNQWYYCSDGHSSKVDNINRFKGNIQLLLFERKSVEQRHYSFPPPTHKPYPVPQPPPQSSLPPQQPMYSSSQSSFSSHPSLSSQNYHHNVHLPPPSQGYQTVAPRKSRNRTYWKY